LAFAFLFTEAYSYFSGMKNYLFLLILLASLPTFAQKKEQIETDKRVAEGFRIYRSEMASWYGSDLFVAKYPEPEASGGYVSYEDTLAGETVAKCVFISKEVAPVAIATFTFDSSYNSEMATIEFKARPLTLLEGDLMAMRASAKELIAKDPLFQSYKGTTFNLVPVIYKGIRKVYVLTGTSRNGVVIMGNDYEIDFDSKGFIADKRKVHKSLLELPGQPEGTTATVMHNHLPETGDLITPTEVCTLLLYGPFTNWETHMIYGRKFTTFWSMKQKTAIVLTKGAVERIAKDAEHRKEKQEDSVEQD
jgi:hypothetical protein